MQPGIADLEGFAPGAAARVGGKADGHICRAAVVARELGGPAVLGVRDPTRSFADGERVVVDGVAGTASRV